MILHITIYLYYLSLAGYLIGVILSTASVRHMISEFWYLSTHNKEKYKNCMFFKIADEITSTIYEDNNSLSHKKLLIVTLLMNSMLILGVYLADEINGGTAGMADIQRMSLFTPFGAYIFEYLSYKATRFFLNKTMANNSIIYMVYDVLLLIVLFYVFPLIALTAASYFNNAFLGLFTLISTPLFPLFIITDSKGAYIALMLPAVFSICLPSLLIIIALLLIYNKLTLNIISIIIEKISIIDFEKLKKRSLILFSLATGTASINAICTENLTIACS